MPPVAKPKMREVVEINSAILNSYAVHKLPARLFLKKLVAAIEGEVNEFTPYMRDVRLRPPANEWRQLREEVFARDDYTCHYCGARGVRLECDHVIAVARGGTHLLTNLVTACYPCNRSKAAKSVDEWRIHA